MICVQFAYIVQELLIPSLSFLPLLAHTPVHDAYDNITRQVLAPILTVLPADKTPNIMSRKVHCAQAHADGQ
jgi:hypothetical protein